MELVQTKTSTLRTVALALVFSTLFIAVSVGAATTISTNITTDGTLSVTGASTLTGNVTAAGTLSVTGLSTFVSASSTALSCLGNCAFGSSATTSISSTGAITAQSTFPNTIAYASTTAISATTASTTNLIVGGNSSNGTIAGLIFGTCDLAQTSVAASTTAFRNCTSATGVTTSYKVFVQATSTLASGIAVPWNGFTIVSASSTAADVITVEIGNLIGVAGTPSGTLNFWAIK